MTNIKLAIIKPEDTLGIEAAIAGYWRANLSSDGVLMASDVDFDATMSDADVITFTKTHVQPSAFVDYMAAQFQTALEKGNLIVAKGSDEKVIGIAGHIITPSDELYIDDERSPTISHIHIFKIMEHPSDVHIARQLLTGLLDVIHQRQVERIAYDVSSMHHPSDLFPDNIFGSGKMGFDYHQNHPLSGATGHFVVAGINGAYVALGIAKPNKVRAPLLQL